MLDLNKITVLALFFATSCGNSYRPIKNSSVQINCPNPKSAIVFLENTDRNEIFSAAQNALNTKRRLKTSESYTLLRLGDGRTTAIYNVAPEDFYKCVVIDISKDKSSNITTPFAPR